MEFYISFCYIFFQFSVKKKNTLRSQMKIIEMYDALTNTAIGGYLKIAKVLLNFGAQMNMPTNSFESPLTLAAFGGHIEFALFLINHGVDINLVNFEGYTALMKASLQGYTNMIFVLIDKGKYKIICFVYFYLNIIYSNYVN